MTGVFVGGRFLDINVYDFAFVSFASWCFREVKGIFSKNGVIW